MTKRERVKKRSVAGEKRRSSKKRRSVRRASADEEPLPSDPVQAEPAQAAEAAETANSAPTGMADAGSAASPEAAESAPTGGNEGASVEELSPPPLLQHHQRLIERSAILPEVARERGYRTVGTKAELRRLGFSDAQCRVPALLIPIYGVNGEVALYQIRSDAPRVNRDGKAIKYETPKGARMVLDVPPRARPWLGDPKRPLFITEGVRKADAGVSAGLCIVALLGVWNWRGRNDHDGKLALPDWDSIALNGREVYVVFDSDVMVKAAVHLALGRLKGFLETRGARVRLVYLPSGTGAVKVGLDDFLASGKTVDDLLALASDDLREPEGGFGPTSKYEITSEGHIIYNKPEQGMIVPVELANFTAQISSSITEDDGVETRLLYGIDARVQQVEFALTVPAEAFASLNWTNKLGPKAIVAAGLGKKDLLREAIQVLSEDPLDRRVYRHLGWAQRGEEAIYLHAAGAIGANGVVADVEVSLSPPLDRYELPEPPEGEERVLAIRESLALLDGLAPDEVLFPMFSIIWRAVIGGAAFSAHVVGQTGGRKTELAALIQRHFGEKMDALNLPGSWSSTANSLEELAFLAKDAVLVVDDFKPGGSAYDVQRAHQAADRLLRAQGNRSGRGRMRADGSLRPARPPRGIILATGEDVPAGHSLRARIVVLELGGSDIDLARLTARQAAGAEYAKTTAAFVRWVAPRRRKLLDWIRTAAAQERDLLLPALPHGRTATIGADLLLAFRVLLRFALEVGAIDAAGEQALLKRGRRAIRKALDAQAEHQAAADSTTLFLELVAGALQSGAAHLADFHKGGVPTHDGDEDEDTARLVGWRLAVSEGETSSRTEWRPGGELVGWIDAEKDDVYLVPTAAFKAAQEMARESPTRITVTERILLKALDEKGLLASKDEDRHTKKIRVVRRTRNAIHLRLAALFGESGTSGTKGTAHQDGAAELEVFPIPVPDNRAHRPESGTASGNKTPSSGWNVPDVPADLDPREERAAIHEHDAELTRAEAERRAGLFEDDLPDPGGH